MKSVYNKVFSVLREGVKALMFRAVYPFIYNVCCLRPLNRRLTLFCEVRHGELTDSFIPIVRGLEEKGLPYSVYYIHNNRGGLGYLWRYAKLCALLPTAGTVLIDDTCNLFGAFRLRKGSKLIQTWHSCGAFKKWGYSIAGLSFGQEPETLDRYPAHTNYSLVTVSSKECIPHFDNAFGFDREGFKRRSPVHATGIARTDYFFDEANRGRAFGRLYEVCPEARGKRVVLYAPTYRGDADNAQLPEMFDIAGLMSAAGERSVLLIKQHGFVRKKTYIPDECRGFAFDVSDSLRIEDLLFVSDAVVTDYSSLIFEYSLFMKPMVFYAPDLDEFYDYRGFYYKYDNDFLPGEITRTNEELIPAVCRALDGAYDKAALERFRERFMGACDGHSTERIIRYITGERPQKIN